ncbi:MAG: hypothetical protein RIQ49_1763, partial [Pseudomonadota bacterium]
TAPMSKLHCNELMKIPVLSGLGELSRRLEVNGN